MFESNLTNIFDLLLNKCSTCSIVYLENCRKPQDIDPTSYSDAPPQSSETAGLETVQPSIEEPSEDQSGATDNPSTNKEPLLETSRIKRLPANKNPQPKITQQVLGKQKMTKNTQLETKLPKQKKNQEYKLLVALVQKLINQKKSKALLASSQRSSHINFLRLCS